MKTVRWANLINDPDCLLYLCEFVDGRKSLRSLRTNIPQGTVGRSEIYKLEKMGPSRAKEAARKALYRSFPAIKDWYK